MKKWLLALASLLLVACRAEVVQSYALVARNWCEKNGQWETLQMFPSRDACTKATAATPAEGRALYAESSDWFRDCGLSSANTMVCVPANDPRIDQDSLSHR